MIVRFSYTGTLDYFKHFGGPNPDYVTDMAIYGSYLIFTGYSTSPGLTNGFNDLFIVSCDKDAGTLFFAKHVGTSTNDEFSG